MTKKIYYMEQILSKTSLKEKDIDMFQEEGLIEVRIKEQRRYFLDEDLEKLQIIKRLKDDLGVNLEGIDVILHMRNRIISMQENFLDFIDEIKKEIDSMKKPLKIKEDNDIIPY